MLREAGVKQAWAGSFDSLFHKDVHGVNERLADACRSIGDGIFVPFGCVNPTLPDWEEDVLRIDETFQMPGIRLHPAYHGYALDDPRFARLLELADERRLIVQLVAQITTERHALLTPHTVPLDVKSLSKAAAARPNLPIIIYGSLPKNVAALKSLAAQSNTYVGWSVDNPFLENRIVFGSTAPMSDARTSLASLNQLGLAENELAGIRGENAARIMTARKSPAR